MEWGIQITRAYLLSHYLLSIFLYNLRMLIQIMDNLKRWFLLLFLMSILWVWSKSRRLQTVDTLRGNLDQDHSWQLGTIWIQLQMICSMGKRVQCTVHFLERRRDSKFSNGLWQSISCWEQMENLIQKWEAAW